MVYCVGVSNRDDIATLTHLHLPGWWVRAFEAACLTEAGDGGAMDQARLAGLMPAFTPLEMHSLAMVLSGLQGQILNGGQASLTIHAQEHIKHLSNATRSRRFLFERTVQMLAALRIMGPDFGGVMSSNGLFSRDEWRHGAGGDAAVTLSLAALGPELILGWSDAHHDLVRFLRGDPQGCEVLGGQSPLTFSRSLWLELQGVEQLLHLRLERAAQWEARWLQLEGVFGLPLAALFHGTVEPGQALAGGDLAQQLKCLARLGRKLVAHGALTAAVADHYLALGPDSSGGLTLVWQVAPERLTMLDQSAYEQAAAAALRRCHDATITPTLLALYLPTEASAVSKQEALVLAAKLSDKGFDASGPTILRRGQLLTLPGLFLEFALRSQVGTRWPLPESIRSHPLASLAKCPSEANLIEQFERFNAAFSADPELSNALNELPFMTLASMQTRRDRAFTEQAKELVRLPSSYQIAQEAPTEGVRPRLIAPEESLATVAPTPRRTPVQSSVFASRMLKTAADELAKMRACDQTRYDDIKQAYLQTLDEASHRLLLDVKKRIQPAMFEEQLRQRLVRYMVDHPGAWRSAEASKANNP